MQLLGRLLLLVCAVNNFDELHCCLNGRRTYMLRSGGG